MCTCCVYVWSSHHEMRLRKDPPELLDLHVLWITSDGFQYLVKKCWCKKIYNHSCFREFLLQYKLLPYLFGSLHSITWRIPDLRGRPGVDFVVKLGKKNSILFVAHWWKSHKAKKSPPVAQVGIERYLVEPWLISGYFFPEPWHNWKLLCKEEQYRVTCSMFKSLPLFVNPNPNPNFQHDHFRFI